MTLSPANSQTELSPPFVCCQPLLSGRLTPEEARAIAPLFQALADPARLEILSAIAAQPNLEVRACQLVESLNLAQPTVSYHLKIMYEAGLLAKERRGTLIYYQLVPEALAAVRGVLGA
ncbi:MAG: metalloregulator ArsR/SmtB family transcription factor [Oscillatoriaceae cyanobacterium]